MPRRTDDFEEEFVTQGFSQDEAASLVQEALREGFQNTLGEGDERAERIQEFGEDTRLRAIQALFDEPEPEVPGLAIGAAVPEGLELREFESQEVYIPSGGRCFLKTVVKALGVEDVEGWMNDPLIKKCSPYEHSTRKLRNILSEKGIDWDRKVPCILRAREGGNVWTKVNMRQKASSDIGYIALTRVGPAYHSAWIKPRPGMKQNRNQAITPKFLQSLVQDSLVVSRDCSSESSDDFVEYINDQPRVASKTNLRPNHHDCSVMAYDIETSCDPQGGLHPWAVGVTTVPLSEPRTLPMPSEDAPFTLPEPVYPETEGYTMFEGPDCIEQFINYLAGFKATNNEIMLFAHNGGKFDHLFLVTCKNVKIIQTVEAGGLKGGQLQLGDNTVLLRDSYAFTQLSLAKSGKALGAPIKKAPIDIAGKDIAWYQANRDLWAPYLRTDVESLASILQRLHAAIETFGETLCSNSLGIAGVAWSVMKKSVKGFDKLKLVKNESVRKFLHESMYGGRVVHWKKRATNLVSLDGNSLYPSAMAEGVYPVGDYSLMKQHRLHLPSGVYLDGRCYVAEVTLDGNNQRYPLIPYRSSGGLVTYPSGEFKGVYTSVEIDEALALGYTIKTFHKGVFWRGARLLFKDLVTKLYEERKILKADNNPMEYTFKILLNSMYGKFAEQYSSVTGFPKEGIIPRNTARRTVRTIITLPNGQSKVSYKLTTPMVRKPQYIASFILSYARRIMNRMIASVGPENVVYSDTDSVYVPVEVLNNPDIACLMHPGLGGFKNDYGDGEVIQEGLFLDYKRYFGRMAGNRCTAKFNGLSFSTAFGLSNGLNGANDEEINQIENFYETLLRSPENSIDKIQERWVRQVGSAEKEVRIDKRMTRFQVNPCRRGDWEGNVCFPLDYQKDPSQDRSFRYVPSRPLGLPAPEPAVEHWDTKLFSRSVPILDRPRHTGVIHKENNPKKITSCWVVVDGKIYHREANYYHLATATHFGPGIALSQHPTGEDEEHDFVMWLGTEGLKGLNQIEKDELRELKHFLTEILKS